DIHTPPHSTPYPYTPLFRSWLMADTHPVPDTMLAAAMDRGGGPGVLSIHRLPVPKPNAGEVLIAVYATGVNVWEAGFRQNPGQRSEGQTAEPQSPCKLGCRR